MFYRKFLDVVSLQVNSNPFIYLFNSNLCNFSFVNIQCLIITSIWNIGKNSKWLFFGSNGFYFKWIWTICVISLNKFLMHIYRANVCHRLSKLYARIQRIVAFKCIFSERFNWRWNFVGRSKASKITWKTIKSQIRYSKIPCENYEPENNSTHMYALRSWSWSWSIMS